MTHSRNEGRWSAVPAIGGLFAALLILSSCGREATSPAAPELAVLSQSVLSGKDKDSDNKVTLRVELEGNGNGMVKSSPKGIACGGKAEHDDDHGDKGKGGEHADKGKDDEHGENCRESFTKDSEVTLTAKAIGRSAFTGWTEGPCAGTTAPTCTVTLSAATSVKAKFSRGVVMYALTVGTAGTGTGTVALSSSNGIINCGAACTASFAAGTVVTLTASASSGSGFASWSASCPVPNASDPTTCEVTVTGDMGVTANFSAAASGDLTVIIVGVGQVDVVGVDGCINEGDPFVECLFQSLTGDVTLNATEIGPTFSHWSGDACDGSANLTCIVPMTGAKNVTATFGSTATVARSGSVPSPLRGTGSASVTSDQPRTLSAFIEQQR